jgi:hypothetical protein
MSDTPPAPSRKKGRPKKPRFSSERRQQLLRIAKVLGENRDFSRNTIGLIIQTMGLEFAERILLTTLELEAGAGVLLPDGSRRRTPGGAFFYLARKEMNEEQQIAAFGRYREGEPLPPPAEHPDVYAQKPSFSWWQRNEIFAGLIPEAGMMTAVKVVLIGRPKKTAIQDKVILLEMEDSTGSATFPKGVPKPPIMTTLYTVYITAKQWRKVADTVNDPKDMLIIEGTCAFDPAIGRIAVYAANITSKALEKAKREQQLTNTG